MSLPEIEDNVALAPHTTIKLGGAAKHFVVCHTDVEIRAALSYARDRKLPLHVLGGGSNTVFSDEGFVGLVLKIETKGRKYEEPTGKVVAVTVKAGEVWDEFVADTVARNLAGVECLSGIPGLVGAAPMQNVGAYGQSVAETITRVEGIDVTTLKAVQFTDAECQFGYRASRFKYHDAGRYVITAVTFALRPDGEPTVRYPEVAQAVAADGSDLVDSHIPALKRVRETVIKLRTRKSMVVRAEDPFSRSCGSFFMNVIADQAQLSTLTERYQSRGGKAPVPAYPQGKRFKVPAGWLIEQAGFTKGERRGGVGISPNHSLALVNYNGTAQELLAFAQEIQSKVKEVFGVELTPEPVFVGSALRQTK